MKKRVLFVVAAVGLISGLFGMQPASAACEGGAGSDPRADGNEVVGVYAENIPVDGDIGGEQTIRTDRAWVEVQDDSEHAPVNLEIGWQGGRTPEAGPVPGILGFWICSDAVIEGAGEALEQ